MYNSAALKIATFFCMKCEAKEYEVILYALTPGMGSPLGCHHLAKTIGFPSLAAEGGNGADGGGAQQVVGGYTAGGGGGGGVHSRWWVGTQQVGGLGVSGEGWGLGWDRWAGQPGSPGVVIHT